MAITVGIYMYNIKWQLQWEHTSLP